MTSKKSSTDLLTTVWELLDKHDAESASPAENVKTIGKALVRLGEILTGIPVEEARRIVKAVAILHDINLRERI